MKKRNCPAVLTTIVYGISCSIFSCGRLTINPIIFDTLSYTTTSQYARVSSYYPTSNWVSQMNCLQANVGTKNGGFLITRGYFTIDLSSLPTDVSQIQSTTFILHSNFDASDPYYGGNMGTGEVAGSPDGNAFIISRVISAWNSSTITWNTQPLVSPSDSVLVNNTSNGAANAVYTFDVTTLVKNAIQNGQANLGFRIRLQDETTEYNSVNIITGVSKPTDRVYAEKLAVAYYK